LIAPFLKSWIIKYQTVLTIQQIHIKFKLLEIPPLFRGWEPLDSDFHYTDPWKLGDILLGF
jgi:hypothetical protein